MAAVVSMLFVKNRPEEVGQATDGDAKAVNEMPAGIALRHSRIYRTREHWTVGEVMSTPVFWLFTLAAVLLYFAKPPVRSPASPAASVVISSGIP
jgi:hypothetical protein